MFRLLLAAALVLPLMAGGCSSPRPATDGPVADAPAQTPPEPPPAVGRPFTLARGESATLDGIRVGFATVLEDSRCPTGTTCVWEGRATINLSLSHGGQDGGVNLELPGLVGVADRGAHRTVEALDHRFTLMALEPYPGSPDAEADATPRATLLVEPAGD